MKKRALTLGLILILSLVVLTVSALADEGFNAKLNIVEETDKITVTVVDSAVLTNESVKLQISCANRNWSGAKVTFDGRELDNVTWDAEAKSVTFPVAAGGSYVIEEATAAPVVPSVTPSTPGKAETPAVKPMAFSDVAKGDWFYGDVKYVYETGLMTGLGDGRFDPNGTVNRAMVVQVLYNLEGKPAAGTEAFTDVADDDWYRDAVAWAAANGIVDGLGDGLFAPLSPVTREQLATMLFRYAVFRGMDAVSLAEHLDGYADGDQVSDWAVSAMNWAVGQGLINGMDGRLNPQGSATRAQTAAILARFCRR